MTTAVSGLIKIGQTGTDSYQERMRNLEANGYYNVVGLKRAFAIELDDYQEKESLLHEIFNRQRIGESELFALDVELAKQLLLCSRGRLFSRRRSIRIKILKKLTKIENRVRSSVFTRKESRTGTKSFLLAIRVSSRKLRASVKLNIWGKYRNSRR